MSPDNPQNYVRPKLDISMIPKICQRCFADVADQEDILAQHLQWHADLDAAVLDVDRELSQTRQELSEADSRAQGPDEHAAAAEKVCEALWEYAVGGGTAGWSRVEHYLKAWEQTRR